MPAPRGIAAALDVHAEGGGGVPGIGVELALTSKGARAPLGPTQVPATVQLNAARELSTLYIVEFTTGPEASDWGPLAGVL